MHLKTIQMLSRQEKTAKVSPFSTRLAKFGLNDQQTNRFFELGQREQALILNEDQIVVKRLLSMNGFSTPQANAFFRYSKGTEQKILNLITLQLLPV